MNQVGFGYGPLCDSLETQAQVVRALKPIE